MALPIANTHSRRHIIVVAECSTIPLPALSIVRSTASAAVCREEGTFCTTTPLTTHYITECSQKCTHIAAFFLILPFTHTLLTAPYTLNQVWHGQNWPLGAANNYVFTILELEV